MIGTLAVVDGRDAVLTYDVPTGYIIDSVTGGAAQSGTMGKVTLTVSNVQSDKEIVITLKALGREVKVTGNATADKYSVEVDKA